MKRTQEKFEAMMSKFIDKKHLKTLVVTLAAIVVFTTTYLLVLPAFTLDKEEAASQGGIDVVAEETAAMEETSDSKTTDEETAAPGEVKSETDVKQTDAGGDTVKDEAKPEEKKSEETKSEATKSEDQKAEQKDEVKLLTKKTTLEADKAKGDDFTVSAVVGKDAKVPEDVKLEAVELGNETKKEKEAFEQYEKDALEALQKDSSEVSGIKFIKLYDISLTSEGEAVEPAAAVNVTIGYDSGMAVDDADDVRIVHFAEDKNGKVEAEVLDNEKANVETTINNEKLEEASFDAEGFSVYAIVGTETIEAQFNFGDGNTYEVSVNYDSKAGIPEGSELVVTELTKENEEYESYVEQTADAAGASSDSLTYIKLLDISIMHDGEKVKVDAPVDVQISLKDKKGTEDRTKVVHFGEKAVEVIEPEVDQNNVNFEASGFSVYSVVSYEETTDLDGKSFAIVQVNTQATTDVGTGNNTVYQGRALSTTSQSSNTRLAGTTVSVERHESGRNLVTSGTTEVVVWEFEAAESDKYYIKAPNGQYLNISGSGLYLSNTKSALTITAGTGNYAGKVKISNENYQLYSSASADSSTVSNSQYFQSGNSGNNNYIWMTLCQIENIDEELEYTVYSGEKISVQDLHDGEKYIIYRNIYNTLTGEYEDWVIDGNGDPVKAYDQGDSVSLHSKTSPRWVLSVLQDASGQPTGYYIFRNEETGLILHPLADGTLVKEYDSSTSPTLDGVTLSGKENGEYTSQINYWDTSAMAYYGYQITTDGEVKISTATGNSSQAFSFAKEPDSTAGLHEVSTVDSEKAGITIHMFNYPDRKDIRNITGEGGIADGWTAGVLPAQHISATLDDNGFPVLTTNNKSLSTLFDTTGSYYVGTGNHLFLESIYDSTGYYEYSAFNNFAKYNDGNFTVYQETGTPKPTATNFYYRRGNFLPYNALNTNNKSQNIYTGDGDLIDYENPSYGSTLYGLSGNVDYYFGMTMDFNFLMPKDGYENGSPLIYEFNGDDDLWIYIDGVLILDIGGVHDAFAGSINFATGEITGGNGGADGARTIKECFKKAGVFPDGTEWDDSKVDEYFNGNTFVNYGSHKFNMFYMEHGAGASNLQTRFNLPVIEQGKITVEKKLDNTSQEAYANVSFAYQAFAKKGGSDYEPLTSAVYEGTETPITFHDNVIINGKTYNNVFYLKPNQAAVFSDMIEDELYYVQEIGVEESYYDKVLVNDVEIEGEQVIEEDGIYKSTEATARNRARVTYTNRCDPSNSNELLITKRLANGSEDNGDTFEFRIMLENAQGVLSAYYQGTYYIRDDDGGYYRYEGGSLTPNGETPYACTAGNYGTISQIPPNYTVVIKDLLAGTDFYVDEIRVRPNGTTSDVLVGDSEWILTGTSIADAGESEISNATIWDYATSKNMTAPSLGTIAWGKDAKVTFTNKLKAADIQLKKVKEDGTSIISGSTFDLTKFANGTWSNGVQSDIKPGAEATETTEAVDNPVDLGSLVVGKYRLTETKAPDGYNILTKHIYFEVYKDSDNGIKARFIDEQGNALTGEQIEALADVATLTSATIEGQTVYTVTVINKPGEELPMTGGPGTLIYTLSGLALIAAALMYGFRMRRRERRSN